MFPQHPRNRRSIVRLAGIAAILATFTAMALLNAAPALAAPYWCKQWQVSGQTWYADQGSYTLMFTLRQSPGSTRFSGHARYSDGDVNYEFIPSQLVKGSVSSEDRGRIKMDIAWSNGQRGQYIATVTSVRRTSSGNLTAGLRGTSVDTTGGSRGSGAYWEALGFSSGIGTSGGRYYWPMFCSRENVLRIPV